MGTVLSHNYVTLLYFNGELTVSDGLKLYCNQEKCEKKGVEFKTRLQLAMELIAEHKFKAKILFGCGIPGTHAVNGQRV